MKTIARHWLAWWLCFAAIPALAQTVYTGELTGNVTDPSGKAVRSAKVDLTSSATGEKLSGSTSETGDFRFSLLRPGAYSLAVSAPGFEPRTQATTVDLGQSSNLVIRLGIPARKEEVSVTEPAPLLQSNNANLTTTLNEQQIADLPNPGNDLTVYAFTAPGVTLSTAGGWGNFSAHGMPSISNLFTINGTDLVDPYFNVNSAGASGLTLGANEIQEVAVVLNGYTGQYGRLAGANVNYVTKSGTNAFHANAVWNYNGRRLNANDWFNNATGTPRPFATSNAWADSLGGPIIKNKLFFFFNNEGIRFVLPFAGPVYIPTADFSKFVLTGLAANNPAAVPLYTKALNLFAGAAGASRAVPVTAASDPSLGCGDFVDPVYGVSKPCAAGFQFSVNLPTKEWLAAAKIDYDASSSDRFYLRLNTDHGLLGNYVDPINPVFNVISNQPSYGGQLGYTKILTARSLNTLLLSAQYQAYVVAPSDLTAALRTFPTTFVFYDGPFASLGGYDDVWPSGQKERQWQMVDDYSWVRGPHTIKAGVNLRKSFVSTYAYGNNSSGVLRFFSMTDFVNGSLQNGSVYNQAFATVGAEDLTFYSAGFYGQDEWRIRPNLVATLSLRLDRNSNTLCPAGCFTELAGQGPFASISHSAATPYNQAIQTGLKELFGAVEPAVPQPRLGLAYSITKNTVLRGGVGVFADSNPGHLADQFITNSPTVSTFSTTSGLVATGVPNGVFALEANSNAALQNGFAGGATLSQLQAQVPLFQRPNFNTSAHEVRVPKYYEWNLELQREFKAKYLLSVNYVGNHGWDEGNRQSTGNGFSTAGLAGLPSAAPDPRFGQIVEFSNRGWSNFDGLATAFRWRANSEFSGQFSYTWSHALDACSNGCSERFNELTAPGLTVQINPLSLRSLNYSNADYDVRHSLNALYTYVLPGRYFHRPALKRLLGGWTVSGTFFYHSGYPFSIVDLGVRNAVNQLGNLTGSVGTQFLADFLGGTSYPGCSTPNVPCISRSLFAPAAAQHDFGNIPRNSFRGPGYFDTDLNVTKGISIAERFMLVVGASFFNVLNHPNFDLPANNLAGGPGFGEIQFTVSPPTSAYGWGAGAAVSGRVVQTVIKLFF